MECYTLLLVFLKYTSDHVKHLVGRYKVDLSFNTSVLWKDLARFLWQCNNQHRQHRLAHIVLMWCCSEPSRQQNDFFKKKLIFHTLSYKKTRWAKPNPAALSLIYLHLCRVKGEVMLPHKQELKLKHVCAPGDTVLLSLLLTLHS